MDKSSHQIEILLFWCLRWGGGVWRWLTPERTFNKGWTRPTLPTFIDVYCLLEGRWRATVEFKDVSALKETLTSEWCWWMHVGCRWDEMVQFSPSGESLKTLWQADNHVTSSPWNTVGQGPSVIGWFTHLNLSEHSLPPERKCDTVIQPESESF